MKNFLCRSSYEPVRLLLGDIYIGMVLLDHWSIHAVHKCAHFTTSMPVLGITQISYFVANLMDVKWYCGIFPLFNICYPFGFPLLWISCSYYFILSNHIVFSILDLYLICSLPFPLSLFPPLRCHWLWMLFTGFWIFVPVVINSKDSEHLSFLFVFLGVPYWHH